MNEMVETECTATVTEKLNLRIFQAVSDEKGINSDNVRGTGTTREFVPEYMKGDICHRPDRSERPLDWDNNSGLEEDGLGSSLDKPKGPSDDGSWSGTTGESGGPGCDPKISPDGTMPNDDEEGGGIFAKCFCWLRCLGAPNPYEYHGAGTLSEEEARKLREESEYCGGGFNYLGPDHPSYNPPAFSLSNCYPD